MHTFTKSAILPVIAALASMWLLLTPTAQAGSLCSKALTAQEENRELLVAKAKLSNKNAKALVSQHPHLNPKQVSRIIKRIRKREKRQGRVYSQLEFMSKFALYASELVGWRN